MTTGAGRPFLSIVIPAYNEEDRLGASLSLIDAYLRGRELDAEILVVDDGSTDRTASMARAFLSDKQGRVLSQPENLGKGAAVRRGVLQAAGRWVLITDADLSTPIEEHAKLARLARDEDLDVVFGSRALPDSQVEIRQRRLRELMGKTFNLLLRLITGLKHRDTQCGFKLLDGKRTRPLFEKSFSAVSHYAPGGDEGSDQIDNDGDGEVDEEDEFGDPREAALRRLLEKIANDILNEIVSTW